MSTKKIRILFDGPPEHNAGRFVEVEDENGESIRWGEWSHEAEFWVLTAPNHLETIERLRGELASLQTYHAEALESATEELKLVHDRAERAEAQINELREERVTVACNGDTLQCASLLELQQLREELERERIRLVACGVVAMADTPDSAADARDMLPEYRSASCDDVSRRVDECMGLRAKLKEVRHAIYRGETAGQLFDRLDALDEGVVFAPYWPPSRTDNAVNLRQTIAAAREAIADGDVEDADLLLFVALEETAK